MRQAGLVVWHALKAIEPLVRPGVTTAEIDAVIAEIFAEQQCRAVVFEFSQLHPGLAAVSRGDLHLD